MDIDHCASEACIPLPPLASPPSPPAARVDLPYAIPLSGALRAAVLRQLLATTAFSLGLVSVPSHDVRAWVAAADAAAAAARAAVADAAAVAAGAAERRRAGEPEPEPEPEAPGRGEQPAPRIVRRRLSPDAGIVARRARAWVAAESALSAALDAAAAQGAALRIRGALLIIGATPAAPRWVAHVAFGSGSGEGGEGGSEGALPPPLRAPQGWRAPPPPPSPLEASGGGGGGGGEDGRVGSLAGCVARIGMGGAAARDELSAGEYAAPLAPETGGAVARKAARALITDAVAFFGLGRG
jgi:hypothetical protein